MKEIIGIIRQRLVLITSMLKLVDEQKEALKHTDAKEISRTTKALEPYITKLGLLETRQQKLLNNVSIEDWLKQQPDSPEKQMSLSLLDKLMEQLAQLKLKTVVNKELLKRDIKYVDYNVNVMTQTSAGVTYGTSKSQYGDGRPVQGVSMFEANT